MTTEVSIHAPTWGATAKANSEIAVQEFQSTHPRGVRPGAVRAGMALCVSIHAPTWGATVIRYDPAVGLKCVSIHAPTWGATRGGSTPCRHVHVSIHAPTWGATSLLVQGCERLLVSIHAPTWGATACNGGCY